MLMNFFGLDVVLLSFSIIAISIIVIVISLVVLFILKSKEEKKASEILLRLSALRDNKVVLSKPTLAIKKDELSLKKLLIDKFKPVIEKQLKTSVDILDFNAKGETFLVLIMAAGAKLLLVLDSSGKIVDYKKVK